MRGDDRYWMRRALRLAAKGQTPPNPMVGCVIVRDGVPVGEGFHPLVGQPHAEVFALRAAGAAADGATAYVTLEPCAHYGRTPPCAEALIAARVERVVVATADPFPKVAGRGIDMLRAAGIAVEVGLLEAEARAQNAAFFHFHGAGAPYVALKAAMTLDGKIATVTGHSRWITGSTARRHVHRLRTQYAAILCGIGTVLADDPMLTARLPGALRQPARIVLDTHLRTPLESALVRSAREVPLLVAASEAADRGRAELLQAAGATILPLPLAGGHIDLRALLAELARRDIISVLVEGGAEIHAAFLEARLAQRALWFIAPKLVGGREAPGPIGGAGIASMDACVRLAHAKYHRFNDDLMIEGDLLYT